MKRQLNLFIISIIILSCGQTVRLSKNDYSWMPYKGNEVHVFKSNTGDTDTIFFTRKDTLWGSPDPALSFNEYEIVAIFSKRSDPYMSNGHRYLEGYFIKIKKTMSRKAELVIDLSAKEAKFYKLSAIKLDSLSKVKTLSFTTSYGQYDDVYIINSEDYLGTFEEHSNYVIKVYWSKSEGLIRYDKKECIYWELIKKYLSVSDLQKVVLTVIRKLPNG